MNGTIKIQLILLIAFFLSLPFSLMTQEEEKHEKAVKIMAITEIDGEKIIKDTTFTVTDENSVKKIVKEFAMEIESDSSGPALMEVVVDVDEEVIWEDENGKKVIIMKGDGDDEEDIEVIIDEDGKKKVIVKSDSPHAHKKVMRFKSDDGEESKVIIINPYGKHHKSFAWIDEDGNEYEYDFDIDMESFQEEMDKMKAEMKEIHVEILDEKGKLHDELIELRMLEELEGIEDIEELDVIVMPPYPPAPPKSYDFHGHSGFHKRGMEVSARELRDAGIKNKTDRLELGEIDVNKDGGVFDISFSLVEEGNPRVIVYNIYGDKVFNAKPDLFNDRYELKIDLSNKQYGDYYLMIVSGNSSKTLRIRN